MINIPFQCSDCDYKTTRKCHLQRPNQSITHVNIVIIKHQEKAIIKQHKENLLLLIYLKVDFIEDDIHTSVPRILQPLQLLLEQNERLLLVSIPKLVVLNVTADETRSREVKNARGTQIHISAI